MGTKENLRKQDEKLEEMRLRYEKEGLDKKETLAKFPVPKGFRKRCCGNPGCGVMDLNKKGREFMEKVNKLQKAAWGDEAMVFPNDKRNFQCGRCLKISYCSKKCQKEHWKVHKKDCKPKKKKKKKDAAKASKKIHGVAKIPKESAKALKTMRVKELKKRVEDLGGEVPE